MSAYDKLSWLESFYRWWSDETMPPGWPTSDEIHEACYVASGLDSAVCNLREVSWSNHDKAIVDKFQQTIAEENEGRNPALFLDRYCFRNASYRHPETQKLLFDEDNLMPLRKIVDNWKDSQKVEEEFGCLLFYSGSGNVESRLNDIKNQETLDFLSGWIAKRRSV